MKVWGPTPGTFLKLRLARGDLPVDYPSGPDTCAYHHDKDYQEISDKIRAGTIDTPEVRRLVRESDQRLLDCLKVVQKKGKLPNVIRSFIIHKIIQSKTKLEDLGLMKGESFVTPNPQAPALATVDKVEEPVHLVAEESIGQVGQGLHEVMIHNPVDEEVKETKYECCESCFHKMPFCEKMPAYKLKMSMLNLQKNKKHK